MKVLLDKAAVHKNEFLHIFYHEMSKKASNCTQIKRNIESYANLMYLRASKRFQHFQLSFMCTKPTIIEDCTQPCLFTYTKFRCQRENCFLNLLTMKYLPPKCNIFLEKLFKVRVKGRKSLLNMKQCLFLQFFYPLTFKSKFGVPIFH